MSYALLNGVTVHYEITACWACGTPIALETNLYKALLENHKDFMCPHGHSQHFTAKSWKQRAEEAEQKLANEVKAKQWAQQDAKVERERAERALKEKRRLKERIKNGVCPCCKRSFVNLHRHMTTKHPHFNKGE